MRSSSSATNGAASDGAAPAAPPARVVIAVTGSGPGSGGCGRRRGRAGEAVVALVLQLLGELLAALLDDAAVDEDVHEVGLDVAQDAGVVRDEQNPDLAARADPVDALGDDAQGVDVETGVGLVEDRHLGLEQLELYDLVALLLAAGEALVDVALGERRVHLQLVHGPAQLAGPGAQLGRLAVDRGLGRAEEVGDRD